MSESKQINPDERVLNTIGLKERVDTPETAGSIELGVETPTKVDSDSKILIGTITVRKEVEVMGLDGKMSKETRLVAMPRNYIRPTEYPKGLQTTGFGTFDHQYD